MPTRVSLEDVNGNLYHQAKLDDGAEVAQLIPAIITTLRLPVTDEAGRRVTYHLAHNGRRMQENETLGSAEVQDGDTLVVVPEMTAGGQSDRSGQDMLESLIELESTNQEPHVLSMFPQGYHFDVQGATVYVWFQQHTLAQTLVQAKVHKEQEVGGILLGNVYQEDKHFLVSVEKVLEAQHTLAGTAFVTFTDKTWLDLLQQRHNTSLHVLGWYHSHPGFGIFLSSSDEFIHRNLFDKQPWYIALVVDPLADTWGVFSWEEDQIKQCSKVAC